MDKRRWKIGDLAAATGLTVRALRHFDDIGLLCPAERSPAGHRWYTGDDVQRLYRILALRQLGIALGEIAHNGIHELLDFETARAVAQDLTDVHEAPHDGGGVSGPRRVLNLRVPARWAAP
jgi:DNA-binding transcriptional MerR regulator